MRKTAFYLSVVFTLLVLFIGTGLQSISFVVVSALTYLNAFTKKEVKPWILVVCILMFLLNMSPPASGIDLVAWTLIAILSLIK